MFKKTISYLQSSYVDTCFMTSSNHPQGILCKIGLYQKSTNKAHLWNGSKNSKVRAAIKCRSQQSQRHNPITRKLLVTTSLIISNAVRLGHGICMYVFTSLQSIHACSGLAVDQCYSIIIHFVPKKIRLWDHYIRTENDQFYRWDFIPTHGGSWAYQISTQFQCHQENKFHQVSNGNNPIKSVPHGRNLNHAPRRSEW